MLTQLAQTQQELIAQGMSIAAITHQKLVHRSEPRSDTIDADFETVELEPAEPKTEKAAPAGIGDGPSGSNSDGLPGSNLGSASGSGPRKPPELCVKSRIEAAGI